MTLAAIFLGSAKTRLLPPSIPLRFFTAAAAFHILMWLALLAGAAQATSFTGGPGPVLTAVHLLTLGVLTTTAIGASTQLLPVATRLALVAVWPVRLVFWLTIPGLLALTLAMYAAAPTAMIAAATVTAVGLLLFCAVLADNLRRASSLPIVAAYGWAAIACLVLLIILGLALSLNYRSDILANHAAVALAHMILGGFGFMGLLALGFSHVLVPMFALSSAPPRRPAFWGFILAVAAVALGSVGAFLDSRVSLTVAALIGFSAAAIHLRLMRQVLKSGMRKRLGPSFLLIRGAWLALLLSLVVGLASLYGYAGPNGATLFGFLVLGGWLLTFLFGSLQRILPFLASMHTAGAGPDAPLLLSELSASIPIKLHTACHAIAVLMVALSIATDVIWLVSIAAGIGLLGALSFAWFTGDLIRRVFAVRWPA